MSITARSLTFAIAALLASWVPSATAEGQQTVVAPQSAEMPELSGPGQFGVGTEFHEIVADTRTIGLRIWYPAVVSNSAARVTYRHTRAVTGQQALHVTESGIAVVEAKPDKSAKFPLVLLSHGYGGWAEHMSRLGEVLASKGYIVASIDHRDPPFHDGASFAMSFGSVLLNRAADQQLVLGELLARKRLAPAVAAQLDTASVGLIGFSMGGYGALTTAGVAIDQAAPAYALMPPAMRAALPSPDPALASRIKAIVALAPWGAQPSAAVWQDADLARLPTPLLLVDGDRDDVVDFKGGVQRLFANIRNSDRYLLVYREAAHNIAGNPVTLPSDADFSAVESVSDPVWRKERIEAINAHFITAFLGVHLKGDIAKRSFLNVPTPVANDGQWPSAFGQQWGGMVAGDMQPGYWRGFQRRWARGLEMHHKATGE